MNKRQWDANRRHITTKLGQWHAGEDVSLRGEKLLGNLIQTMNHTQLLVFSLTGKKISHALSVWLEKSRFTTSYSDSRIWCNQIASFSAGSGATPVSAMAAGLLAADSNAYGSRITLHISHALHAMFYAFREGESIAELVGRYPTVRGVPLVPGFVRPVRVMDERIAPLSQVTSELELELGPYMSFANELSAYLDKNFQTSMNAGGYCCAFLLDQGFSPEQIYLLSADYVSCGVLACYNDNLDKTENRFLPLRCGDIEYTGESRRSLLHERRRGRNDIPVTNHFDHSR